MTDTSTAAARPSAVSDYFQPPPKDEPRPDHQPQQENTQGAAQTPPERDPGLNPGQDPEEDPGQQPPHRPDTGAETSETSQGDPVLDRAAVERLYRRGLINIQTAKRAAAIIKGEAPAFRNNTPPKQPTSPQGAKQGPRPSRRSPVIPGDYEDTHPLPETPSRKPAQQPTGPAQDQPLQNGDADVPRQATRPQQPAGQAPPQNDELVSHWTALTKTLSRSKGDKFNLGALLRDCPTQQLVLDGDLLTAHFKSRENLNRLKAELADPSMVDLVQTAFRAEFGENAQITFNGPQD